jgi:ABC-2 type transport system permease protein
MTTQVTTQDSPQHAAVAPEVPVSADALRAVVARRDRPVRPGVLSTSLTFTWRALLKIKHVPEQLFDVTLFPVMSTLLFTYLFGGALAGSTSAYLQFVLPGILVQTVIMITMYTGVTLNTDITKGVFDRFRSLPVWRPSALVGALLADTVRYTLASVMILALGLALGFRPDGGVAGVALAVAVLLVFAFSASWIWTALALVLRTPQSVMGVSMMILFPITFISNVFVSPETMPGWLAAFVDVNPVSHVVTVVRALCAGAAPGSSLLWVGVACAVMVAVFGPLTMRLYRRKN